MTTPKLIERLLSFSKADDCIVIVSENTSLNLRWANNTTTTNGLSADRELVVIAIKDRRVGTIERSHIDEDALEPLMREAEAACDIQEPAEDYAELVPGSAEAGWDRPTAITEPKVFAQLVPELAEAFEQATAAGHLLFGYAEHTTTSLYLANSRGLRRRHDQRKGQLEITAKTADFATSAWVGRATQDFTDVAIADLTAQLADRMEWSKTKIDLPAGKYDTLLEPSAVADLLIYAYWTAATRDATEGRTVYSQAGGGTRVGEQLAPKEFQLFSDSEAIGLEVAPFEIVGASSSYASVFDNGLALQRTSWIKDGVLEHLITPRYLASDSKTPATPYIDNLICEAGGTEDLSVMIAGIKRGLLVTCLWYIREVDPQRLLLTGLTRDGVFLIENGRVMGAVNNFRFNMSPTEMMNRVAMAGSSQQTLAREWGDYFTWSKMPPLLISEFNMSSVSQAT